MSAATAPRCTPATSGTAADDAGRMLHAWAPSESAQTERSAKSRPPPPGSATPACSSCSEAPPHSAIHAGGSAPSLSTRTLGTSGSREPHSRSTCRSPAATSAGGAGTSVTVAHSTRMSTVARLSSRALPSRNSSDHSPGESTLATGSSGGHGSSCVSRTPGASPMMPSVGTGSTATSGMLSSIAGRPEAEAIIEPMPPRGLSSDMGLLLVDERSSCSQTSSRLPSVSGTSSCP